MELPIWEDDSYGIKNPKPLKLKCRKSRELKHQGFTGMINVMSVSF